MIQVLDYSSVMQLKLQDFVFINNKSFNDANAVFFCYFEEDLLVGILRLNVGQLVSWFSYIEVLPAYRGRGIATALIKYLFMYSRSNRLGAISVSHFTQQGNLSIKHKLARYSREYNIKLIMDKR